MPLTAAGRAVAPAGAAPPEPELTPEALIARASALRPMLREQQDENDARGTYSEALHREFLKAGLYRILQPRMFGGYEFEVPTFYKAMLEISRGHPGVGWCLALCASIPSSSPRTGPSRRSANSSPEDISQRPTGRCRSAPARRCPAAIASAARGAIAPAFPTPRMSWSAPSSKRAGAAGHRAGGAALRRL